jgi:hypothetical protein
MLAEARFYDVIRGFCDCARNSTTVGTLRALQLSYDEQYIKLADDPRFKGEDFTVIRQPHMRDMEPPIDVCFFAILYNQRSVGIQIVTHESLTLGLSSELKIVRTSEKPVDFIL